MIEFHCPICQKHFNASDAMAGRELKCGNCNSAIIVPASPTAPRLPVSNEAASRDEALDTFIAGVQTNSTATGGSYTERRSTPADGSTLKHTASTPQANDGTLSAAQGWPIWKSLGIVVAIVVAYISCNRHNTTLDTKNATIQYWVTLQHLTSSFPNDDTTPEDYARRLEQAANEAANLPTFNVDQDAVMCGLALAQLLRDAAALCRAMDNGMLIVDTIIRGVQGDPFGTYNDVQSLTSEIEDVRQRCVAVRAVLTARYRTEFPPLNL